MIPLRDTLILSRLPVVNRTLVVMEIVVFTIQAVAGEAAEAWVKIFGFVPARFFNPAAFGFNHWETGVTLMTSLFMHGGFVHLIGNLIYLWIFGDDVEERMGRVPYLLFFLACGAAGSLTHAFLFPTSTVPSIGASGSIAGILGAFLVFHPRARIMTLIPLVVSYTLTEVPALVFLPIWFGMQFLNGWFAIVSARGVQEVAGVAWWAHVGGFVFGAGLGAILKLIDLRKKRRLPDAGDNRALADER